MNSISQFFRASTYWLLIFGMTAMPVSSIGCGAVGPPIPPEDVGIEAKARQQRQDQARKEEITAEDQTTAPVEEAVELPPLYPIGTR